jgi:hypothetical protein
MPLGAGLGARLELSMLVRISCFVGPLRPTFANKRFPTIRISPIHAR